MEQFEVGDRVLVRYQGTGFDFPAKIVGINQPVIGTVAICRYMVKFELSGDVDDVGIGNLVKNTYSVK